mmetsp:Transcript_12802/g.39327  ORF Transcript_12802/g.39327 Transcript_12802/m.39327 type:complete len:301 (-) Transcript_12802:4643-5545(-)
MTSFLLVWPRALFIAVITSAGVTVVVRVKASSGAWSSSSSVWLFASSSLSSSSSSSTARTVPSVVAFAPARLSSRSPRSCVEFCRIRQKSSCILSHSSGNSLSRDVLPNALTMERPAPRAASRTLSASSANPRRITGRAVLSLTSNLSLRVLGMEASNSRPPSLAASTSAGVCTSDGFLSIVEIRPFIFTSLRATEMAASPSAAPDRSAVVRELLTAVASSQPVTPGSDSAPSPSARDPSALAAVFLTSGIGSRMTARKSGRSRSRYGTTSLGFVTWEHMDPTMAAARFFSSLLLSRSAR